MDEQGGFRAGKGCVNQGFAVRQVHIREGDWEGQGEVSGPGEPLRPLRPWPDQSFVNKVRI